MSDASPLTGRPFVMIPRTAFPTMDDQPLIAPSVTDDIRQRNEAALSVNSIAFTISREMALDFGIVEPTPEEAEKRAADLELWRKQRDEKQAAAVVVVRALDAVTDATSRAVLDLHQRSVYLARDYRCEGCDADGYEAESPAYPCATTRLVASLHGLAFPDEWFELDRPEDGSLDWKAPS